MPGIAITEHEVQNDKAEYLTRESRDHAALEDEQRAEKPKIAPDAPRVGLDGVNDEAQAAPAIPANEVTANT